MSSTRLDDVRGWDLISNRGTADYGSARTDFSTADISTFNAKFICDVSTHLIVKRTRHFGLQLPDGFAQPLDTDARLRDTKMAKFESDIGPALILETTLPDRDVKALHEWAAATVEAERERCAKIVQEATLGETDRDIRGIIRAIRLVG